tara:strand:+ start:120 stop:326 length:207 start_codon:yes stop_codon:yes gene_type:complete
MTVYDKAVAGLTIAGHTASAIKHRNEDVDTTEASVYVDVHNIETGDINKLRIHHEEIEYWATFYNDQQ